MENTTITIIKVLFEIYNKAFEKTKYLLKTASDDELLRLNDWPAISGTTHKAKSTCGKELVRTQAEGGINGSVNHHKFYQKTCLHTAVEETIEEMSLEAGVTLQAEFNGSNNETKTKSILGSLVLARI